MELKHLYENLFGTLDRKYCVYYQALMYLSFFMLASTGLNVGMNVFSKGLMKPRMLKSIEVMALLTAFISYFSSRLLYSVCSRAL